MFRVEYLKLSEHPQLGSIKLFLSDVEEIKNVSKPYTSVIIGPNGTGKSFILRTISDILTQFNIFQTSGIRAINLPFSFHIRYKLNQNTFEIVSSISNVTKKKTTRTYLFYKNRPFNTPDIKLENQKQFEQYRIDFQDLFFPTHVIVNSVMLNDRFVFKNSEPEDFYQYLGVRATNSTASTKSAVKGVINNLFSESLTNNSFLPNLKELLNFLEFNDKFEVEYNTKLNKLFFSGKLTVEDFKQYYEFWWDDDFEFSNRSEKNPIWSKPFYDKYYQPYDGKIEGIVTFLNELANSRKLDDKYNSKSKFYRVDFFRSGIEPSDLKKIIDLEKLDIINVNGINLDKRNSKLSIGDISSGEYHLLISLIGIFSKIKDNALILIDEPEISLHPNWQMQYITFLKKVFGKFSSCQFIITTHSHFIVSDLENESSSVTALKRNQENNLESTFIDINTFGWSAEQTLLEVFSVPTTRNYYIADKIGEILELISSKERNSDIIKDKVSNLINQNVIDLSENDPLASVWEKIVVKYG